MDFDIVIGNIVDVVADAIVLPANKNLKEGSGASAAIFNAAGRKELENACERIGHCKVGSAVPTPAFNMDASYIIHAVVPRWKDGMSNEYRLLSSAYLTALQIADVMQCETIAFPLLASGNNGFDKEVALEIAKKSIESFRSENLEKAILVIYDRNDVDHVRVHGYGSTSLKNYNHKGTRPYKKRKIPDIKKGLDDGVKWLKKPSNIKKVWDDAIEVIKLVNKLIK